MKLKLEAADEITILVVTEDVSAAHLPILKAGLNKLFQSEKKMILLDLSSLKEGDFQPPAALNEVAALSGWAQDCGATLSVVSPIKTLSGQSTRDEAIASLKSPLGRLLATENLLQATIKDLESRKAEITQKMNAANADGDARELRRENSDLKSAITSMEGTIRAFLKNRTDAYAASPEQKEKFDKLTQILDGVLQQAGK